MSNSAKDDFDTTEWKGQHSGVHNPTKVDAGTQAEWEILWNTTHSNVWPVPKAPVLPEGKMALGIFLGQQNVPAIISIAKVEEMNGQTIVNWNTENIYPKPGQVTAAVMLQPFLLKWVDKTETVVRFKQETQPPKPIKCWFPRNPEV